MSRRPPPVDTRSALSQILAVDRAIAAAIAGVLLVVLVSVGSTGILLRRLHDQETAADGRARAADARSYGVGQQLLDATRCLTDPAARPGCSRRIELVTTTVVVASPAPVPGPVVVVPTPVPVTQTVVVPVTRTVVAPCSRLLGLVPLC